MVRLTVEIVERAYQFTNAVHDRELHLRGYKAPAIENFGSTHDQFDTVDLTDNEIRKLDGFPLLKRLKHIILTDNKIIRIAEDLTFQVPNLETLILSGNNFAELKDLDPLSLCKNLTFLTLAQCPVALKPNYRLYVVFRIPNLRFLDYRRVTKHERDLGRTLFRHLPAISAISPYLNAPISIKAPVPVPRAPVREESVVKTFVPGAPLASSNQMLPPPIPAAFLVPVKPNTVQTVSIQDTGDKENQVAETDMDRAQETSVTQDEEDDVDAKLTAGLVAGQKRSSSATAQDLLALQTAIKRAKTIEEVERLQHLLTTGHFVGFSATVSNDEASQQ